jgi:hypothetical protein
MPALRLLLLLLLQHFLEVLSHQWNGGSFCFTRWQPNWLI